MARFKLIIEDSQGRTLQRLVEAGSLEAAREEGVAAGFFVRDVRPAGGFRETLSSLLARRSAVREIIHFTRLLGVVVKSGLAINRGLRAVLSQLPTGRFHDVTAAIISDVEGGSSLSESLRAQRGVFDQLYIGLVVAGEASGQLGKTLDELSRFLMRRETLRKRLRAALSYPIVVSVTALVIGAFFIFWLIPRWQANLSKNFQKLPAITEFVFGTAHFFRDNWALIAAALAATVAAFLYYGRTPQGQVWISRAILKVPILGRVRRYGMWVRLTRALQILTENRVMIVDALEIAGQGVGDPWYGQLAEDVRLRVEGGELLSASLPADEFPPLMRQMVAMGEETGRLAEMLAHVADYYDSELEDAFQKIQTVVQPLIIVALGIFVGGLVLALFLPMFGGLGKVR